MSDDVEKFIEQLNASLLTGAFVKMTLGKSVASRPKKVSGFLLSTDMKHAMLRRITRLKMALSK